jgi:hypothetical protein
MKRNAKNDLAFSQTGDSLPMSKIIASGEPMTLDEAMNLSEIMLSEQNFTSVDFSNSSLSSELLLPLSLGMLGNRHITSIDVGGNPGITVNHVNGGVMVSGYSVPKSFTTFLKAVDKNPVTSLNLSGTNMTGSVLEGLATALSSRPLKFLDLSGNWGLGHAGTIKTFGHIADIVHNPNLLSLNLSNIGLKMSDTVLSLARGLKDHPALESLELSGNHIGTEPVLVGSNYITMVSKGFTALIEAIAPSKTLKYLGLANSYITIDVFGEMLKALEHSNNKVLSSINLNNNPLWNNGSRTQENEDLFIKKISRLQDLLSWKSKSLDSLDISDTFGSVVGMPAYRDKAVKAFADTLGGKHSIKKLNLSTNMLGDKAIMYLIKILKAGSSLEELDLSNNNITGTSTVMLEQVLSPYTALILSQGLPDFLEPFMKREYTAEVGEARKVLEKIKFPDALAKIIEAYYDDGVSLSGKFVVPGKLKKADDMTKSINSSDDIPLEAMLSKAFLGKNSEALESILDNLLSGIASDLVSEYHGGDFTSEPQHIELVGDGAGVGTDVVIHV